MARAASLRENTVASASQRGGGGSASSSESREVFALGESRLIASDVSVLEASLTRLRRLLTLASRYCAEVSSGAREGDVAVGRALADTLAAVPPFDADAFQRTFGSSVQDLLMTAYLATLTQAQVKLAELISALKPVVSLSQPQGGGN